MMKQIISMHLTFHGAAHEVTGSCYLLEIEDKKILVDCGMFQGSDFNEGRNHDPFPFAPSDIDAVLVTHAHVDHTGRIPKLVKDGFRGKIFITKATADLAQIIWNDAANIMQYDARKFQSPILFDTVDIAHVVNQCVGVDYYKENEIISGVTAVWKDAGHIFGAGFIEVTAEGKRVIFSGDIGNRDMPILRDTDRLGAADVLLCESTYGDRAHETREERRHMLVSVITDGIRRGGTIMVPAFSIERTQELIYELHIMREEEKILPKIPIFLDSPMAIDALAVYKKYPEYYDRDAARRHMVGEDFLQFPGLVVTRTPEESKKINRVPGPKMVIAGAGMMNGGRILHHAYRYLSEADSTLLIIGYQAQGTLGRRLYEGAEEVKIFGEKITVRCAIKAIGGLSAHADQEKLVNWIRGAEKVPEKIYCTHGEAAAATALAHRLRDDLKIPTFVPTAGERVEI